MMIKSVDFSLESTGLKRKDTLRRCIFMQQKDGDDYDGASVLYLTPSMVLLLLIFGNATITIQNILSVGLQTVPSD